MTPTEDEAAAVKKALADGSARPRIEVARLPAASEQSAPTGGHRALAEAIIGEIYVEGEADELAAIIARHCPDQSARVAELEKDIATAWERIIELERCEQEYQASWRPMTTEELDAACGVTERALQQQVADQSARVAELEWQHTPVDSYACQRCGRRDGLDAVIPNEHWAKITGGRRLESGEVVDGSWNLLCLWCIDALAAEHGIKCSASLHFAGKTICGRSQSDAEAEHIGRLCDQRAELEQQVADLTAKLAASEQARVAAEAGAATRDADVSKLLDVLPIDGGTSYRHGEWQARAIPIIARLVRSESDRTAGASLLDELRAEVNRLRAVVSKF